MGSRCGTHGRAESVFIRAIPGSKPDQRDGTRVGNRIEKAPEDGRIEPGCVASEILGVSERLMFEAPVKGETGAAGLSEMARGKLKKKAEPRKVPPD
jgi:hypothetical protein